MLKTTDDAYIRMVAEKAKLEKKVEALDSFIKKANKGEVENITRNEIELLKEQYFYMNGYLRILKIRIQLAFESAH